MKFRHLHSTKGSEPYGLFVLLVQLDFTISAFDSYISIEDITDEEFQSLSDAEKVKLINEQADLDINRTIELLTNIDMC